MSPDFATGTAQKDASFRIGPRFLAAWHRVQLKSVPDQFITEFIGNRPLQPFDLLIAELDHTTGLQVNEMIVMGARHFFITRATIAEIVSCKDVGLFEQPNR